jgi:hypothetical protein
VSNQVKITIGEEEFVLDAELFRQYKDQAFEALEAQRKAKKELKDTVDVVAEVTGLKKGLVSKFFKSLYELKMDAAREEVESLEALKAVVTGQAEEVEE